MGEPLELPRLVQWAWLPNTGETSGVSAKAHANGFLHAVRVGDEQGKRLEILHWCSDNFTGNFTFIPSITRNSSAIGAIYFMENQTDASAFKIRWG